MFVKIKTWDQMEEEFGLDSGGDINCKGGFLTTMEKDVPKNRIIEISKSLSKSKNINHYYDWKTNKNSTWTISNDMIEEFLNPKDHPQYFI